MIKDRSKEVKKRSKKKGIFQEVKKKMVLPNGLSTTTSKKKSKEVKKNGKGSDSSFRRQQVKKNIPSLSKSFYFTVFYEISKGLNPTQIAKKYNVSKQRINYYIQKLSRENCIRKVGYGVWEAIKPPTKEVKKEVKKDGYHRSLSFINHLPNKSQKIRSHAFMFRLSIKVPSYWEKRAEILKKLNISFKQFRGYQSLQVYGKTVMLYDKVIIVHDKTSYTSDSASKNRETALLSFFRVIKRLENLFRCEFAFSGKYRYEITREHHSLINNSLAKKYEEENKKLRVADAYGKWAEIDNSFNLHEFEIYRNQDPNKNQAIDDTEGVVKFFNSLKATGYQATPEFLIQAMATVTQNQLIFAKNQESHIKSIKSLAVQTESLASNVSALTELISELKHIIQNLNFGGDSNVKQN